MDTSIREVRMQPTRMVFRLLLVIVLARVSVAWCEPTSSIDPAQWPQQERERYLQLQSRATYSPDVSQPQFASPGARVMIAGATEPLAVHAGFKVLEQGGTAADALVATAIAQVALSTGSAVSYAGILNAVYFDAASSKVYSLNAGYNTVQGEKEPLTIPDPPQAGGRTVLVPGFMAGVGALHARFGKLKWETLLQPAIWVAEQGVALNPSIAEQIRTNASILARTPEGRRIFFKADGAPYARGESFRQPDLAQTLKQLSREGVQYMYSGDWAQRFVDAVRREGGHISMEDMKAYQAQWHEPMSISYRNYQVFSVGNHHLGGRAMLGSLKAAEVADLRRFGPYASSPETLRYLIQIVRIQRDLTFLPQSERAQVVPGIDPSIQAQISLDTAKRTVDLIRRNQSADRTNANPGESHTSIIVAVDSSGNVASMVHSINSVSWGTNGIFVGGVAIPDAARIQRKAVAEAGPGERLPDPTAPVLITRDGKPYLASGAIGNGPRIMLYALESVLDFGMDVAEASALPQPLGAENLASAASADGRRRLPEIFVANSFSAAVIDKLQSLGQPVVMKPGGNPGGYWVAIQIDSKTKAAHAAVSRGLPSLVEGN